jgi:hypothetical protein
MAYETKPAKNQKLKSDPSVWNITPPWSFVPTDMTKILIERAIVDIVGPKATPAQRRGYRSRIINESIALAQARFMKKRELSRTD